MSFSFVEQRVVEQRVVEQRVVEQREGYFVNQMEDGQ
jgi:hypothetical protein